MTRQECKLFHEVLAGYGFSKKQRLRVRRSIVRQYSGLLRRGERQTSDGYRETCRLLVRWALDRGPMAQAMDVPKMTVFRVLDAGYWKPTNLPRTTPSANALGGAVVSCGYVSAMDGAE